MAHHVQDHPALFYLLGDAARVGAGILDGERLLRLQRVELGAGILAHEELGTPRETG